MSWCPSKNRSSVPRLLLSLGLLVLGLFLVSKASASYVTERTIISPDGTLVFTLERDATTSALVYSVTSNGRPVIAQGALGLGVTGVTNPVAGYGTIAVVSASDVNTTWSNPFGERAEISDHCRDETLSITYAGNGTFGPSLQVRAYNEGIALRYLLTGTGTVASDKTSFPLPSTTQVWTSPASQDVISQQAISSVGTVERPVLAALASDLYAAVGEAALIDGSRMKLVRTGTSTLVASLGGSIPFTSTFKSPWRFTRVASSPAALLQGNAFMLNLNEPSRIADTSWIHPGKVIRELTLTTQGGMACIDFAAAHGLQYIEFDAGWYGPENTTTNALAANVDPSRSPGPLDLPAVIAYGKQKGIGVILYVNQVALTAQIDQIVSTYESWGVAGIKFGYVTVGSQASNKWLHDSVAKCADHHLLVDIHDDYRPTGLARTYPNMMSQEGIRGDEESPSNADVLRSIFTRCLVGAADQSNCYFATRVPTMGSHASQLAKSVCVFSAWQFLYWYDRPAASPTVATPLYYIQEVPELTFYDRLPTVWDETRVLDGYPGTHVLMARRKGTTWFLAGLNSSSSSRTFSPALDFLDATKNFKAEFFVDDSSVATATKVRIDTRDVNYTTTLSQQVAASNGFTAILTENGPFVPTPPPPPTTSVTFKQDATATSPEGFINVPLYQGVRDTSLVQESPNNNYGGRDTLQVGLLGSGKVRLGLTRFDVSALAGKYASIRSLKLRLHVATINGTTSSTQLNIGLQRPGNAGWIEGTANGAAQSGTACWNYAAGSSVPWLGGTNGDRLATDIFGNVGSGTLSNALAPVGSWVEIPFSPLAGTTGYDTLTGIVDHWTNGTGNAGVTLNYGTPYVGTPQWEFNSSQHATASFRPELIVEFVPSDPYGQWATGKGLTAPNASADLDPDHDGIPNAMECILGCDPLVADAAAKLPTITCDSNQVHFRYRLSVAGIHLQPVVQYSTTLQDWHPAVNGTEGVEIAAGAGDPDGTPTYIVSMPRQTSGKLFLRLAVAVP